MVLLATVLSGCKPKPMPAASDQSLVAASVAPLAYFVDQLAGEHVQVVTMIPPGASPHTYEPTIEQMRALARARLYVKVGHPKFPFEQAWMDKILARHPELKVVNSSSGLAVEDSDPHVWLAPEQARGLVSNIAQALVEVMPEARVDIEQRRDGLLKKIEDLDQELRAELAPYRGRRFYVFHPAWGYFARAYGLEQVAIEAHGKEPSPEQLAGVIAQARREGVKVIFVQPQFSEQSARVVAEEIGARLEPLDPLAYDWAENLRRAVQKLKRAWES